MIAYKLIFNEFDTSPHNESQYQSAWYVRAAFRAVGSQVLLSSHSRSGSSDCADDTTSYLSCGQGITELGKFSKDGYFICCAE
jgi:hypothetical protein